MKEKFSGDVRNEGLRKNNWNEKGAYPDTESADIGLENIERKLKRIGVALKAGDKVLEVGSGDGALIGAMQRAGIDAVGVDVRPRGESVPQVRARIEELPFDNGSFDLVIAQAVFDASVYDQSQPQMLSEIARVLKKGGVFLSSHPSSFEQGVLPAYVGLNLISKPEEEEWNGVYQKE